MTHEEMEKAMQFIIEQQAQFAADIQQMREVQAGFQTQLGRLTEASLTLVSMVGKVVEAQGKTEERFSNFIKITEERFMETDKKLAETDDRLNTLIDTVERYISGRNGKEGL